MRGKFEYPQCLLDACILEEDRQALITGIRKTSESILVKCKVCGREYYVRIHDIYRKKISADSLIKPLICRSCSHKMKPSGIVKKQMDLKKEKDNGRRD